MSAQDSDVVVLVSAKHRAVISRIAAQHRKTDGLGDFEGHVRIHRIKFEKSNLKPGDVVADDAIALGDVLVAYGIPDENGKCRNCETGKCRTVRVGVMVMSSSPVSHGTAAPWTRMRVRGSRKRKNNTENPLLHHFDPRHIAREAREIQSVAGVDPAFFDEFNRVDLDVRNLELEENRALAEGGSDVLFKLKEERKKLFIAMLKELQANGRHRLVAEYISKIRPVIFPQHVIPELRRRRQDDDNVRQQYPKDELTDFDWMLRESDETAAEIRAARKRAIEAVPIVVAPETKAVPRSERVRVLKERFGKSTNRP